MRTTVHIKQPGPKSHGSALPTAPQGLNGGQGAQVSFLDHKETRKLTRLNGLPAHDGDVEKLRGPLSRGEFGGEQ